MKKPKKILAWIGIAVLLILYLVTFILGIFGSPKTHDLFMACVVCTVIVPVLIYAMLLAARTLSSSGRDKEASSSPPAEKEK